MSLQSAKAHERPDSIEALRLLEIYYQNVEDGYLQRLLRLLAGRRLYLGVPIGLLLAGTLVRGVLARSEDFAEYLDDALIRIAQNITARPDSKITTAELRSAFAEAFETKPFSRLLAESRQRDATTEEALESYLESIHKENERLDLVDLPAELARDAIAYQGTWPSFTLDHAEIMAINGWVAVGKMRVTVRQVSAWWLELERVEQAGTKQ